MKTEPKSSAMRLYTFIFGSRSGTVLDSAALAWRGLSASDAEARSSAKADVGKAWRVLAAVHERRPSVMPYVIRTSGIDQDWEYKLDSFIGIGNRALGDLRKLDVEEGAEGVDQMAVSDAAEALFQCVIETAELPERGAIVQMTYGTRQFEHLFDRMLITCAHIQLADDDHALARAAIPGPLRATAIALSVANAILDFEAHATDPLKLPASATLRAVALRSRLKDTRFEKVVAFLEAVGLDQDARSFERDLVHCAKRRIG